ncbi:exo-alpha-sialidase [Salinibacterium sp. NG253]|uniref:exo-alpha-sialidase n=1 Tax=Salinibacterium sp. NG253 TaxID=2792039 RepID=UPI0018CD86FB|nr:exo-alpha-sialidase [Salinibacterium sp. NG253]MBH0116987.1 exo-alpha-sialidase [Salinibacterium sp. NG253]
MKLRILSALALSGALIFTSITPAAAVAPDGWSTPTDISTTASDASHPQVAVASDNTLVAVWTRSDGSNVIVQSSSSTDRGVTWSVPLDLSAAGQDAEDPQIAVAPNDTFTAVWDRFDGSNSIVQSSSSTDGGVTWSAPIDVSVAGQPAQTAQVSAATDNSLTAVWRRNNGSRNVIQASSSADGGATWSTPVDVSDDARNSTTPQVTIAADNTRTAVWRRNSGSNQIIQASTSTDNGITWSVPADLSAAGQDSDTPQISAAPDNSLTALWERSDGSDGIVQVSTSNDSGASWSVPVDLSAAGGTAVQGQITVAADGSRTAVWLRGNGSERIAQVSTSTDGGATWSAAIDISAIGENAREPQLAATPDNTLVAVWHRQDSGDRILQASFSTDQGVTWSPAADISAVGSDTAGPEIVAAADGAFTIVWALTTGGTQVIQSAFGLVAPEITSAAPPAPALETAYSFQLTATGIATPTFAVSSGTLPTGLTLSADGLLSGTPTAAGEFTFTVTASNGTLPDATATYTLTTPALDPAGEEPLELLPPTGQSLPVPLMIVGGVVLLIGAGLLVVSRMRNAKK